jgi:hypothetical protein
MCRSSNITWLFDRVGRLIGVSERPARPMSPIMVSHTRATPLYNGVGCRAWNGVFISVQEPGRFGSSWGCCQPRRPTTSRIRCSRSAPIRGIEGIKMSAGPVSPSGQYAGHIRRLLGHCRSAPPFPLTYQSRLRRMPTPPPLSSKNSMAPCFQRAADRQIVGRRLGIAANY